MNILWAATALASLSSFMPTQPGTAWVYRTPEGVNRVESLRSLDADGTLHFDVEERLGTESVGRFSYESVLEGERWIRRGPLGEEILEVVSTSAEAHVPAGRFSACLKLRRPGNVGFAYLAPAVGLVLETTVEDGHETPTLELTERVDPSTEALRYELERLVEASEDAPIRADGTISTPKRIAGKDPEVPVLAARAHLHGEVRVDVLIERDGSVSSVRFLRSSPLFDEEVRRVVPTWRYEPTRVNGKPVRVILTLNFKFE